MKKLLLLLALISSISFAIDKKTPTGGTVKDKPGQSQSTVIPEPSKMTDTQATKMGFKAYRCDISGGTKDIAYKGGIKATVSGANLGGMSFCRIIPYQLQDGEWRIKIVFVPLFSTTPAGPIVVNGLSFEANWSVGVCQDANSQITGGLEAYASNQFRLLQYNASSWGSNTVKCSGDFQLNSKPTWAY